jgi:DNA modification methylase
MFDPTNRFWFLASETHSFQAFGPRIAVLWRMLTGWARESTGPTMTLPTTTSSASPLDLVEPEPKVARSITSGGLTGVAAVPKTKGSVELAFRTNRGSSFQGLAEEALASKQLAWWRGKVDLILTSPPFPLNRKKRYGNLQGEAYAAWLSEFAPLFKRFLKPTGSIVMEMGNAWEAGLPVMSTLSLRSLLRFLDAGSLHLCQEFIVHNPARLPGPVQWVNVERIRVKDSFTHVWWMSPTARPKADNRQIQKPYSASMIKLLKRRTYNSGARPSDHSIGATSFLRDNGGAIPSNVLEFSNTLSSEPYLDYCRQYGYKPHPARMQSELASFFIRFLTDPDGVVLDPFAGSNTTGAVAERLGRRWVSIEPKDEYVNSSWGRFLSEDQDQFSFAR